MYRIVLYGLLVLVITAVILGSAGLLYYKPLNLLGSLLILSITCFISNLIFAKIVKATVNMESSLITVLILFFIFDPLSKSDQIFTLIAAALIAMASKYILAYKRKHIFNPAAISAFLLGLLGTVEVISFIGDDAIWWVGSDVMLPVVAVIGFLIVRKIRRLEMVLSFLIAAIVSVSFFAVVINKIPVFEFITQAFISFPLIFFGTVMLTEPWTSPHRNNLRILYAVITGILFGAQFEIGPVFSTPELALITGNIFAFTVSPRQRLLLRLKEKRKLAKEIYEFIFKSDQKLAFSPGQYLEWTLPLTRTDDRGNRRYFTISSSPTEDEIKLGVRIQDYKSSTFKQTLMRMKIDETLDASQLTGDFILPKDKNTKLVFIAGGIGITPFRSMIRYILDTGEKRDIVLLYFVSHPDELAYTEIIKEAESKLNLKYYFVISKTENIPPNWTGKTGRLTEDLIKETAPDYNERFFYISGPNAMVETYKKLLREIGIKRNRIRTDYFPGF